MLTLAEARATALVPVDAPAGGLAASGSRRAPARRAAGGVLPATATARALSNGLVEVAVNADGTLDVTGARRHRAARGRPPRRRR